MGVGKVGHGTILIKRAKLCGLIWPMRCVKECNTNFNMLVALESWSWGHESGCSGSWDNPDKACQIMWFNLANALRQRMQYQLHHVGGAKELGLGS